MIDYGDAVLERRIPAVPRITVVGVVRETAARERRVALTPADVEYLSKRGFQIVVEQGAGWRSDITDAAYKAAGAAVVSGAAAVFEAADIVAWVKPPAYELDSMPLRPGQMLAGFQDPVGRAQRMAELRRRGVESIVFEQMSPTADPAGCDPLSVMSAIAGDVAYRKGRELLPLPVRERPVRTLVLGCGRAGMAAIGAAVLCGDAPPVGVGTRLEQEQAVRACGAGGFLVNSGPAVVQQAIAENRPDLVVCAAGRGTCAPLLLDWAELDLLAPGAVVVDLAGKAGGNCVATAIDSTVTLAGGVLVTHRSNYPATRPRAASRAYGAATAAALLRLVSVAVA